VGSYLTGSFGSILAVAGAAAEGTRPGRTTMYFASIPSSNTVKILTWPDAAAAPTVTDVTGLATTSASSYVCTGPDGLNPCSRANPRAQAGWITDTELGVLWTSSQNAAAGRPYPYVRALILDPSTLAVLSQPDIYSTTSAWLYPAVAVDERGHLGGVVDNLGGTVYPTMRALIRDDLSPVPAVAGWETYALDTSNSGTSGRWGDYNGAAVHEKYPQTWVVAGHTQVGGTGNGASQTRTAWFGRQRDDPASVPPILPLDFYSVPPCRLADTRSLGAGGPLISGVPRAFLVAGACGVPADATAVAVNLAVVDPPGGGYVTLYPGNRAAPVASSLNFNAGVTRSNNAAVRLSTDGLGTLGAVSSLGSGAAVDLVIDVTGYYR
jgi:hypothetical protein